MHNVCGDAPNDTRLITPGRVVATYRAGSEIAMSFFIATNHLGRLALQLCNLHAESEAECSAPLQRLEPGAGRLAARSTPPPAANGPSCVWS